MPRLSGLDLLCQLRAAGQSTPVVITSGSLAAVSQRELQAVAPARFLPKPFTLSDLLGVVRELLEWRSAPKV
jgi:CheY-like chemotaxis protein